VDTQYTSANANNICSPVNGDEKRGAANIVKLGVVVCIQDYGLRRVNDRMHRRYKNLGFSSDTPMVKP
jgi:hypothetical protein